MREFKKCLEVRSPVDDESMSLCPEVAAGVQAPHRGCGRCLPSAGMRYWLGKPEQDAVNAGNRIVREKNWATERDP